MALFHKPAPVDYNAQLRETRFLRPPLIRPNFPTDAFEEFLSSFKSSNSTSETSAVNALASLNIDDDEYDFVDDAHEQNQNGTNDLAKKKYVELLRKVADRQTSEICIELDDLDIVSYVESRTWRSRLPFRSTRSHWRTALA